MSFEFDPFDPKFFHDPYPSYTTMRREHPVYKREVENHRVWPHYWMISRAIARPPDPRVVRRTAPAASTAPPVSRHA